MPRPIQSLTLSFGLVNVPVRLYAAAQSKAVSFHWLSPEGQRVTQRLYAPSNAAPAQAAALPQYKSSRSIAQNRGTVIEPFTGGRGVERSKASIPVPRGAVSTVEQEVSRESLLKGYELAPKQYVALTPDELKALEETANRHAEIQEFIPLESIDPVYFEKTYYLGPDKAAEKVYRLLARALRERNSGAIARIVQRGKEKMVLVRANQQDALILEMLYWGDEVRDVAELHLPDVALRDAEVDLAEKLLDSLSTKKWTPGKYHDTYRERVLELIRKKQAGQDIAAPLRRQAGGEVVDLMEALKRSLQHAEHKKSQPSKSAQKERSRGQRKAS
jgi:DNA end-binding protein Ku